MRTQSVFLPSHLGASPGACTDVQVGSIPISSPLLEHRTACVALCGPPQAGGLPRSVCRLTVFSQYYRSCIKFAERNGGAQVWLGTARPCSIFAQLLRPSVDHATVHAGRISGKPKGSIKPFLRHLRGCGAEDARTFF